MKDKLQRQIERLTRAHKRHSRWQRLVAVLAGVVALCTLGVLMMPAVAMEGEPRCGKVEHTHTDSCYTQVLTCGQEEGESHAHTEACYTSELTCGLEEHTHTVDCYQDVAEPTATPEPETTAEPTETPAAAPDDTEEPTATPEPTQTPEPTATPEPTEQPEDDAEDTTEDAPAFATQEAVDGVVASGTCGGEGDGSNLTWKITDDGTLTISGEGVMKNYSSASYAPWYAYKEQCSKLVIDEGVESIGDYAFRDFAFSDVQLPQSLIRIGRYALENAYTGAEFTIPENVKYIYYFNSSDSILETLIVPYGTQLTSQNTNYKGQYFYNYPYVYTRKLVWNTDNIDASRNIIRSAYTKEIVIGSDVTKITTSTIYNFLYNMSSSGKMMWGGPRVLEIDQNLSGSSLSSNYKYLENQLTTGTYYIDGSEDQVAFYRIEEGNTATLMLLLAPEMTDYTIPATVPTGKEDGADQVPVTAIMPGAFTKAPMLKSLTIETPGAFTNLPDYAFNGAMQLETINGETHAKEILKQFTNNNLQKGSMPFLGTKIIGESDDAEPTLDGYTVTSADGTLQVTVKTAQGTKYPTKTQDNAYLYYTGEEAVTQITISNPGTFTQTTDNGDVVRVYASMSDTGVTSNYTAGNTYDIVAKAGDNSTTAAGTYKLTVTKIDDVTYCYEFQRPLNGDTYSIDLKQNAPSGKVGNRDCLMRAVIVQKEDNKVQVPGISNKMYEKLSWRVQPYTYSLKNAANGTYTLKNENGEGKVALESSWFGGVEYTNCPPYGYGLEKLTSIQLTYVYTLPKETSWTEEEEAALSRGENTANGSKIISATTSKYYKTPIIKSVKYDTVSRKLTVTVSQAWNDTYVYPCYIEFGLHVKNPEENQQYKLPFQVTGKIFFAHGGVQTLNELSGEVTIKTGTAEMTPYIILNNKASDDYYNYPDLYWGQTYPVTVGVKNETLYDYKDKLQYVVYYLPGDNGNNGKTSSYTYLSANDLESIFGVNQQESEFRPVVSITGAELCQEPAPKTTTLTDGTSQGEITRQYSSVDTDTKYSQPVSTSHNAAKTTNASITIKLTQDRQQVEMTCTGDGTMDTVTCEPTAEKMQAVLDKWGYVVTLSTKTTVTWSYSQDKSGTVTIDGNSDYKIADFTVTVKDAFMFKDVDTENSVTCQDSSYYSTLETFVAGRSNYYNYARKSGYGRGDASISTSYQINGKTPEENQQPTHGDVLQHTDTFTIYRGTKVNGTVPLVDITSGAQVLLAEVEKNQDRPWAKCLKTVTYNGREYYLLNQDGKYEGVWLSGDGDNADTYTYADEITVTGTEGSWTNMIRLYTTADRTADTRNDLVQNFYYLTQVCSDMVPKYAVSGVVWAGDHQTHRLVDYYKIDKILNYTLAKEIVPEAAADAVGAKSSAISSGETVMCRITLQARDDLTGEITLPGKDMMDLLPASLTDFRWTKGENVTVSYDFGIGEGAGTMTGNRDDWEITTPDAQKPNQQAITWKDGFSITFGSRPVYIYVQLTYPQNDAWDAYVDAYSSTGVTNTFRAMGVDDSVSHSLKVTGKAVLQKGVYKTYTAAVDPSWNGYNYYGYTTLTVNKDKEARNIYSSSGYQFFGTLYYITLKNDGKTKLYLNDIQDVLPAGEKIRLLASGNLGNRISDSSKPTDSIKTKNGLAFTAWKASMVATVTPSTETLPDGRQRVTFHFSSGGSETRAVKYDAAAQKYYLDPGEVIQFGYLCYSGSRDESEETAVNTATMPYDDYNESGVELGSSRFSAYSSDMVGVQPNDDTAPTLNNQEWAAANGFDTQGTDANTQWLTSSVTQHLGKVELGLTKTLHGSNNAPNTKPNAIANGDTAYWCISAENTGTAALEDYTITDEMQQPYKATRVQFQNNPPYSSYEDYYITLFSIYSYDQASDTFRVGYEAEGGGSASISVKVNGEPCKIKLYPWGDKKRNGGYKYPYRVLDNTAYISITRDDSGKYQLSLRMKGAAWAIPAGGKAYFFVETAQDSMTLTNKTYTNTAWLTPLRDDLGWDGTATKGVIDENLSTPYWGEGETRTSIRSSANVMVSYGYSTSSSIAVSQKDPADDTVYSTSSNASDTTTILPDKSSGVHYTLTVDNTVYSNPDELTKLVLINNLPQVGDHNAFQDDDMRGSEYRMSLIENNQFTIKVSVLQDDGTFKTEEIDPKYIKIQYSTKDSFTNADWSGTSDEDWTNNPEGARSFRIIIDDPSGESMPKHSKITVEYDAIADDPDNIEPGQTAYNSFGYHYELKSNSAALEAAPTGVGLRTPYVPTLQKHLETPDGTAMAAGADANFNFVIYEGAAVTLPDDFTEADLATALNGHTYTYVAKTVDPGQMESDAPWLKDLKQYSYTNGTWTATDKDWTWTNGSTYNVIELPVTGDYRYGSINRSTALSYSFTYNYANKNTLQCVNIGTSWAAKLTKTDAENGATLADAYFALYSSVQADQMTESDYNALAVAKKPDKSIKYEGATWYLKSVDKTGADGTLTWAGLSASDYLYVEVQAPNGYNLDSTVRKVSRPTGGGTALVTVTNKPGYNLPETGGIGTWPFMAAGLLLTGTALALLLKKRKTDN